MAFHNLEAVRAVQEARGEEQDSQTQDPTEDIFMKQLQEMGINLDADRMHAAKEFEERKINRTESVQRSAPTTRQGIQEDIIRVKKKT